MKAYFTVPSLILPRLTQLYPITYASTTLLNTLSILVFIIALICP